MDNNRSRNFGFLLYPESINKDFENIILKTGAKFCYILHNMDLLEDLTSKKEHYHFLLMYNNARYFSSIKKLCLNCGGNGYVEIISNLSAYSRYMTHIDQPKKYKYSSEEVFCLGGLDYDKITTTSAERANKTINIIKDMINYIEKNRIYVYSDFIKICVEHRTDWLKILVSNSGKVIKDYIKSNYWARGREVERYYFKD